MEETRRKPRADAVQNRERLIEAAKEILGRGGPGASLEAVARAAGVGIGTLYRHFPAREDLFRAVYRREVEQMIALADALRGQDDPLEAIRAWIHALIGVVATKRGLLGTLAFEVTEDSKATFAEMAGGLTAAGASLLDDAQARGAVRIDVTAEDVMATVFGLCYARPAEPGWEAGVLRLIDIFLDGLRVRA